jgi:hypothetical protein
VSNAPVCHISKDQDITEQPKPTLLPFVPAAIDLPSALQAIQALRLIVEMLAGQTIPNQGGSGFNNGTQLPGLRPPAPNQNVGKRNPNANERYSEVRSQRVEKKLRVFQDNDPSSSNWVDIKQVNAVTWVDNVTGEKITWSR